MVPIAWEPDCQSWRKLAWHALLVASVHFPNSGNYVILKAVVYFWYIISLNVKVPSSTTVLHSAATGSEAKPKR